jgi:hypothetical protein
MGAGHGLGRGRLPVSRANRLSGRYAVSVMDVNRESCPYAAFFCEENIWRLARQLIDGGAEADALQVLLFSNPNESVLLLKQRAAPPVRPVVWDYHVVLRAREADGDFILDPDSRLQFPTPTADYLRDTFPDQSRLPPRLRTLVRSIPAASYLAHFYSDRSHMQGRLPRSAFPDYPIIRPDTAVRRIELAAYRDPHRELRDGSRVTAIDALIAAEARAAVSQPGR